jgi:hypothetical protein
MDQFWVEAIGYAGTAATIASYSMRTIVPLRIAGILSSVFFISYGLVINSWPILLTECIILPLNIVRLVQVLALIRRIEEASTTKELSAEWLKPFGRRHKYAVGDVLFSRGEVAEYLLVLESGRYQLREAGITLGAGELVGEMGFLSPGNRRTMTLVCVEPGTVSAVTYSNVKQLYFSNPKFAFYFLRLVSDRLFENVERAEKTKVEIAEDVPA